MANYVFKCVKERFLSVLKQIYIQGFFSAFSSIFPHHLFIYFFLFFLQTQITQQSNKRTHRVEASYTFICRVFWADLERVWTLIPSLHTSNGRKRVVKILFLTEMKSHKMRAKAKKKRAREKLWICYHLNENTSFIKGVKKTGSNYFIEKELFFSPTFKLFYNLNSYNFCNNT